MNPKSRQQPTGLAIERDFQLRAAFTEARRKNPLFDKQRKKWLLEHQEKLERMEWTECEQ